MKKQKFYLSGLLSVLIVSVAILFGFSKDEVKYPDGYRNWTHVKTLILEKGHPLYEAFGGIHHIYANKTALEGYKAGNKFKDGSVIVFDLLETVTGGNAIAEGYRKVVGVMEKNSKKYKDTGGWGFEGFKGDTRERVVKNMYGECFSCHLSEKDNDYVFSKYRN
ncbi:MAG: cytochrome P460 family protein [Ignavibacterium sp.]